MRLFEHELLGERCRPILRLLLVWGTIGPLVSSPRRATGRRLASLAFWRRTATAEAGGSRLLSRVVLSCTSAASAFVNCRSVWRV